MAPIEKLIKIAKGELGYTEHPKDSNITKYGQVYGIQSYWCVIFLWWLFREAGLASIFYNGNRVASCRLLLDWATVNGLVISKQDIQAGDIVILNFSGTNDTQHCGLVIDSQPGSWCKTIEGNTTPGEEGSQDNGGCVALKKRYPNQIVGAFRPKYKTLDYIGCWAEDDMIWGIEHGLINGYEDGSFQPNRPLTRAEMMVILRRYDNYRFGGTSR